MKTYGLIGKNLSHSFSKPFFEKKFENESIIDSEYLNFTLSKIEELPNLISSLPDLCGLNVTIPYKEEVIKYLDKLDQTALEIGAVNTIKIHRTKNRTELVGFNTDIFGFENSIKSHINSKIKKALVLGMGGAAKSVAYVLKKFSIDIIFVSRNANSKNCISFENLSQEDIQKSQLIINTTPIGMFPDCENFLKIPYQFIGKEQLVFDLIYNPSETMFLKFSKQNKAKTINGLKMLELQAEESWKIFQQPLEKNYTFGK